MSAARSGRASSWGVEPEEGPVCRPIWVQIDNKHKSVRCEAGHEWAWRSAAERHHRGAYRLTCALQRLNNWEVVDESGNAVMTALVVLVPGLASSHGMWSDLLRSLREEMEKHGGRRQNWLACSVDNRGTGGSDAFPAKRNTPRGKATGRYCDSATHWSVHRLAEDAWLVADAVIEAEVHAASTSTTPNDIQHHRSPHIPRCAPLLPIILVGHSLGSAIVCRMLLQRPHWAAGVCLLSMNRGWLRDWLPPRWKMIWAALCFLWWRLRDAFSRGAADGDVAAERRYRRLVARAQLDLKLHFTGPYLDEYIEARRERIPPMSSSALQHRSSPAALTLIPRRTLLLRQYVTEASSSTPASPSTEWDGFAGQLQAIRSHTLTRAELEYLRTIMPVASWILFGADDAVTPHHGCRALARALHIPSVEVTAAHMVADEAQSSVVMLLHATMRHAEACASIAQTSPSATRST
eukprot:ctg_1452.g344